MRAAQSGLFVPVGPRKKNENKTRRKKRNRTKTNVLIERKKKIKQTRTQNLHFVLASCCVAALPAEKRKSERAKKNVCFQSRRCA